MKRAWVTIVAALGVLAPAATAQQDPTLQQALSRPVSITIPDRPIGDVFEALTRETKVRFVLDADTVALLPYGKQTHLAVKLENITLRDALSKMLAPSGLRWTIDRDAVRVLPSEPLYRMGRMATFDELQVLGFLLTSRLEPVSAGGPVLEQLRKLTATKDLKFVFDVPGGEAQGAVATAAAEKVLPGTPAEYLDMFCDANGWTWYLSGTNIMILPRARQVERQLRREVSLRYQNERLETVLTDLAQKAHVKLDLSPGVLSLLPANTRTNFNLMMSDATVAQALEVISGATGLVFERTPEGILVNSSPMLRGEGAAATTVPGRRAPFFVRMNVQVHGTNVEVLLRSDELPDDVVQIINAEKDKLVDRIRATGKPAN